jgi:cbb3-type cytochrome oxidase subunit 3
VKEDVLSQFAHMGWLMVSMIFFFISFIGIVIWTFRRSRRKLYTYMSQLPLDDKDPGNEHKRSNSAR